MAKTFSFSRHSRFVNQFKGNKSKTLETNEFAIETNYKKNRKSTKDLYCSKRILQRCLKI